MSVQNIGTNKWRVVVKGAIDPDTLHTKHISKIYTGNKDGAKLLEANLSGNYDTALSNVSLKAYFNNTFIIDRKKRVSNSTVFFYEQNFKYVEDSLGLLNISNINIWNVEDAIHKLRPGYTRVKVKRTLNAVFNDLISKRLILFNPVRHAKINNGQFNKYKYDSYSTEEVSRILESIKGEVCEGTALLMIFTGMRKEEALALDFEDIDFTSGTIKINKAWTMNGKSPELLPVKTHSSVRTVFLNGYCLDRLKLLSKSRTGPIWAGLRHRYVLPTSANVIWKKFLESNSIRYIPISHLRHTFATNMLAKGADMATLSEYIGHSQKSTTYNYYLKPNNDSKIELSKKVSDIFK